MNARRRSPMAIGLTIFLVFATGVQLAVTAVYTKGARRVREAMSIDHAFPRIMARPIVLRPGDAFPVSRLLAHLDAIGYYSGCLGPGCYVFDEPRQTLAVWGRSGEPSAVRLAWKGDLIASLTTLDGAGRTEAAIEPETLLTLADPAGSSFSPASHDPIPRLLVAGTALCDAIVASEDRWFFTHHGLDFARLALIPFGGGGASTVTMQVARLNVLRDRSRTLARKLNELGVAMAIERAFPKDAVLDAYINSVGLGARGGRPVLGFGAAAREFFGVQDVRRLNGLQAATLVALLNQPSRYLDHLSGGNDDSLRRQRNRVLGLMHRNFPWKYSDDWVRQLTDRPVVLSPPPAVESLHRVSRHFLDYAFAAEPPPLSADVSLTLDADRQRMAVAAIEEGLQALDPHVPVAARPQLQAALIAVDPFTGEVLAMVGGRSYQGSQLNRAVSARRQVGSILKPFDYLAAFERARAEGRRDISPLTSVLDKPTKFSFRGWPDWTPGNYGGDYAGAITWKRALAESRNVAAVKVAAIAGFDRVAALWRAASGQEAGPIHPSIALGAIEASPAEVAAAYTIFATGGIAQPLRALTSQVSASRRVASAESTNAIAGMLQAVVDEGTGRSIRAAGFSLDAAGKTGTTNGLRDAWFAGFSGRLLTVVWVGLDNDQPLGLTGAQAALPIWTSFMKRALQP
jgi:penicillin-binding protein 1B